MVVVGGHLPASPARGIAERISCLLVAFAATTATITASARFDAHAFSAAHLQQSQIGRNERGQVAGTSASLPVDTSGSQLRYTRHQRSHVGDYWNVPAASGAAECSALHV